MAALKTALKAGCGSSGRTSRCRRCGYGRQGRGRGLLQDGPRWRHRRPMMAHEIKLPGHREGLHAVVCGQGCRPAGRRGARSRRHRWQGASWEPPPAGVEIMKEGGSFNWRRYEVPVPAAELGDATKITLFIYHDQAGQGSLCDRCGDAHGEGCARTGGRALGAQGCRARGQRRQSHR